MIVVNDTVFMQDGKIIGNPFKNNKVYTDTVFWILENRPKVELSIRFWIGQFGLYNRGVNIDDCFHITLDYFINDESLDFDENYFKGDAEIQIEGVSESEYNILSFIHRYTRFAVHSWLSDNKHSNNSNDLLQEHLTSGEDVYFENDFILDIEDKKLNTKFNELIKYKEYFMEKGFIDFDFLEFIGYYFFDVIDESDKTKNSVIIKNQCKRTAKNMNVSYELIELIVDSMKKDFLLRKQEILDLAVDLEYLIKESSGGWKPLVIEGNAVEGGEDLWDMK